MAKFVLALRDAAGKLVFAQESTEGRPDRPRFSLFAVPGSDLSRSTVYVSQIPFTEPPGPDRPCGSS